MRSAKPTPSRHVNGRPSIVGGVLLCGAVLVLVGCTGPRQWVANGFQVGPDYRKPTVPVAEDWIDADDQRVRSDPVEHAAWWTTFNDPVLSELVGAAYQQNLTLRVAGFRILEARALRAIAVGSVFPQLQQASADYSHNLIPGSGFDRHFSRWNGAFNLACELDFWGRFRRAVEAADADLDASVENYGDVLVTLVADVATTYVDIRTLQRRLILVNRNLEGQRGTFELAETRFIEGLASEIDMQEAKSNFAQTDAFVPLLEIAMRQSQNQLCVLLGILPEDLSRRLGDMPIPSTPLDIAVGIPAELLVRRPDVRRAERLLAAQSARIGIAESDFYPRIAVTGTVGVDANQFKNLFRGGSSFGSVGPSFRWNVLNYGRIANNVRVQDALFQQLLLTYQETVLSANAEAENALVLFLRSQRRLKSQTVSALAARRSNELVMELYGEGAVDYNRVFVVQNFATQQEDAAAQAKGDVANGLIAIYRALGGGWQNRLDGNARNFLPLRADVAAPPPQPEAIPPGDHDTRFDPDISRLPAVPSVASDTGGNVDDVFSRVLKPRKPGMHQPDSELRMSDEHIFQ